MEYSKTEPKVSQGDVVILADGLQLLVKEIKNGVPYGCTYNNEMLPNGPYANGATAEIVCRYKKLEIGTPSAREVFGLPPLDPNYVSDIQMVSKRHVATIMKDWDEANGITPGYDHGAFPITLDKKLEDGSSFYIGDKLVFISFLMHTGIVVGEETLYQYACKLDGIYSDFVDPKLIKRGTTVNLRKEPVADFGNTPGVGRETFNLILDKDFNKNEVLPDTYTRKMSVEDILKEYGDTMSEEALERLKDIQADNEKRVDEILLKSDIDYDKMFVDGLLFGACSHHFDVKVSPEGSHIERLEQKSLGAFNKDEVTVDTTDYVFAKNCTKLKETGTIDNFENKNMNIIQVTVKDEKLLKNGEFDSLIEKVKESNKTSLYGIELEFVVSQPWGSYTPTKDGFFIPPNRKTYNPDCVTFSGHISDFVNLRKDDTLYNILMNERENFLTSNSPFPTGAIQARIEEIENKTVYQDKDRDSFVKCGMALDLFMSGHKGFIAGGCFKNIFLGQKIKDVDIFFENMEDWSQAFNYYSKNDDFKFVYQNANAFCFKYIKTGQKVEIIRSRFGKPEDLIREFDFTVAKFAYYKDTSNDITEYRFVYHPDFFEHLVMKKLVMDESCTFPVNTFERTYRYQKYGFSMCRETKQKLIKLLQGANVDDIGSSLYFGFD